MELFRKQACALLTPLRAGVLRPPVFNLNRGIPPVDLVGGGPHRYLEPRDETESYDARWDMDIMTGFLEDVVAADTPAKQVSDFLSDDMEAAMERIAARKPFIEEKFSRATVNKRLRAGDHRDLMRQQM